MWSPTHIQVRVQRAKGLLTKGKNGTNNCFVIIALGKEKYQTSVKEKAEIDVSWNEECELKIPDQGNRAELVLTCLHKNNLSIDEFLGQVTLPLNEMDVYDRPRSKWFKLESKPGKEKKNKERGELEVRISFTVKSGSLTDLSKKEKHKSSIGQLASSVGGSLLSIGQIEKRKGIKKFAKSLGSKMHLSSKKKNKDGDDISQFSGSFASIGTPNSSVRGSRNYGQHSEDEDEFAFDNLSHKSSTNSLNFRGNSTNNHHQQLQLPPKNFSSRNLTNLGKHIEHDSEALNSTMEVEEMHLEQTTSERTPPPPSKPPRTTLTEEASDEKEMKITHEKSNEWETKLYGKHLDINGKDALKRRSWDLNPVPLPTSNEIESSALATQPTQEQQVPKTEKKLVNENSFKTTLSRPTSSSSSSSMSSSEDEAPVERRNQSPEKKPEPDPIPELAPQKLSAKPKSEFSLFSTDGDSPSSDFNHLNASFAKFEQRNSSTIFDIDADEQKWFSQNLIDKEAQQQKQQTPKLPQAKPRQIESKSDVETVRLQRLKEEEQAEAEAQRQRAAEDARLEEELRLNEQRLREEEMAMQEELKKREEEQAKNLLELKRREEDEKILNFARKRSVSVEERERGNEIEQKFTPNYTSTTPEQSPKQRIGDNREKRFGKFKYFNKREKHENGVESSSPSPKSNERIIIGHEKSTSHADRRNEITAALAKKYEGKSREELMLIANGMENEALLQRQRVKELEDYLDNLLLRVMETHPKILQNPYSRTTSAKSG